MRRIPTLAVSLLPLLLGAPAALATTRAAYLPTTEDLAALVDYLEETGDRLDRTLAALEDRQLQFHETDDRWSIAEIVEHLVLAERTIRSVVDDALASPPRPELLTEGAPPVKDQAIRMAITNREARRFEAPSALRPSGAITTVGEARRRFAEARAETIARLRGGEQPLRGHFATNPGLGQLDGYQWYLVAAAHVERHLLQIAEIEAAPGYPVRSEARP